MKARRAGPVLLNGVLYATPFTFYEAQQSLRKRETVLEPVSGTSAHSPSFLSLAHRCSRSETASLLSHDPRTHRCVFAALYILFLPRESRSRFSSAWRNKRRRNGVHGLNGTVRGG